MLILIPRAEPLSRLLVFPIVHVLKLDLCGGRVKLTDSEVSNAIDPSKEVK
jgi:hypothetical protein